MPIRVLPGCYIVASESARALPRLFLCHLLPADWSPTALLLQCQCLSGRHLPVYPYHVPAESDITKDKKLESNY